MSHKIHYLQPFAMDKNIGGAYNKALRALPREDYVAITDQDTLKFFGFAQRLNEVLNSLEDPANTLLTCKTNRLKLPNPQVVEELYDQDSIAAHQEYFNNNWKKYGTETERLKVAAGVLMVFNVGTLLNLGGFAENSIVFDKLISFKYLASGKRVLMAQGLYLFHLYRYGTPNPGEAYTHLLKK